jgi:hypothetical protein
MSFNLADLKTDLDEAVDDATTFADLVDKYAAAISQFSGAFPGAAPEIQAAATAIDNLDKALHAVQAAVGG